jgi:hypothetical protein
MSPETVSNYYHATNSALAAAAVWACLESPRYTQDFNSSSIQTSKDSQLQLTERERERERENNMIVK